jgi:MATE family multidrug resistance protein
MRVPFSRRLALPAFSSLAALVAPMLLGEAGQVLIQLTDTVMVGKLGSVALAASALAGNFVMFALYFADGAIGSVAPRIGQSFGAGDTAGVKSIARSGAVLGLGVGVLVALCLTLIIPFLGLLGQPAEVVESAGGYFLLSAWSMPGAMLAVVLGQMAEAVNRPWPVLAVMAGAVLLNCGLNYLLIFGKFGFPELGLEGAGWATLIARSLQALALGVWLLTDGKLAVIRETQASGEVWGGLIQLGREGLPVAGQDVLEGGSFALGSLMLGWLGTTAMAANQIAMSIASLAWMFPMALSTATGVRVAQASGAGDIAGARRVGVAAVWYGAGLMAVCAVMYVALGPLLAGFFTTDPEVAQLAGLLVMIAGFYQISDAVQSVSLGALRGMLDNKVPLAANAVCYWVLSLPTVYVLTFMLGWGAVGVWVGYLPWMVLTGAFLLWRFRRLTSPR